VQPPRLRVGNTEQAQHIVFSPCIFKVDILNCKV
jgi:hypothetical protein